MNVPLLIVDCAGPLGGGFECIEDRGDLIETFRSLLGPCDDEAEADRDPFIADLIKIDL